MDIYNLKLKTSDNRNLLQVRCFTYSKDLITFVASFPNQRIYWVISDQLLRSGASIGANIIEAQAASSRLDFIKYFQIALKSAKETEYWLYLLEDLAKANHSRINKLITETQQLSKMIAASLLTLKGKRKDFQI